MLPKSKAAAAFAWLKCLLPAAIISIPLAIFIVDLLRPGALAAHAKQAAAFIATTELRPANRFPAPPHDAAAWARFPAAVSAWLDDMAPLRDLLAGLHNRAKSALGIPPNANIIFGRRDWLFYGADIERDDVRGIALLSDQKKKQWLVYLDRLHDEARRRGVAFLMVVAPDKSSVYPEFLPDYIRRGTTKRRMDDLLRYLEANACRATILDLRPLLREKKSVGPVFFRHDTHWNEMGAAFATDAVSRLLEQSGVAVKPREYGARDFMNFERPGGDFGNLGATVGPETAPRLRRSPRLNKIDDPTALEVLATAFPGASDRFVSSNAAASPVALVLNDSFGIGMYRPLSAQFSRASYVFIGGTVPPLKNVLAAIDQLKANVVILERVERHLANPPDDPSL